MEKLKNRLNKALDQLPQAEKEHFLHSLTNTMSVFPFNEQEYFLCYMISRGVITFDEYLGIREEYINRNFYLSLFEISAPRGFGETWAQGHLHSVVPDLRKPSKALDPNYSGQYDFMLDEKIRIEVKASRAVDFNSNQPLYIKALSSDSTKRFDMNFQQVKPGCCDVFVWMGVWRDVIRYWVLASFEVEHNKYYSRGQHRGNVGEGQLHLKEDNVQEFADNACAEIELLSSIREAYERQMVYLKSK